MPRKKTAPEAEDEKKFSIEENFALLEDIIRDMEGGEHSLEETFEQYKQGMGLVKSLNGQIDKVEKQIQILSEGDEDER